MEINKNLSGHELVKRVFNLLNKNNQYNLVFDNEKVIYFSVNGNGQWSMFDNGGEIAIEKINMNIYHNIPYIYKSKSIPHYELAIRINEAIENNKIDYERFNMFSNSDIEVFWELS